MALVTERIEDNVLYLELNERIDSSNANQAGEQIEAIRGAHAGMPIILDAEKKDVKMYRQYDIVEEVENPETQI